VRTLSISARRPGCIDDKNNDDRFSWRSYAFGVESQTEELLHMFAKEHVVLRKIEDEATQVLADLNGPA
jgi:hypothetical protein